jgi:hypothetical protein
MVDQRSVQSKELGYCVESGKVILRDGIKAVIGFEKLAVAIDTPAKNRIRMFGLRGKAKVEWRVKHHDEAELEYTIDVTHISDTIVP